MDQQLQPFFTDVQAIYDEDHTTDFLRLFLDPTLLYSCAYFEREDMTLEEAQYAKLDLSLGKCDLHPGQSLLEIGCGWGAATVRAAEKFKVNVTALTLSKTQKAYVEQLASRLPAGSGSVEVRLQGWEQHNTPADRIVSIAAFEHFRRERHAAFFQRCRQLLPDDGRMMLHTIVIYSPQTLEERGIPLTHENVLFAKFIGKEIFPGGQLTSPTDIQQIAEAAGFDVLRAHSLGQHYARTCDIWADNLRARRDEAIKLKSQEDYDRYMRYLTGCADHFRSGHIDLFQFTLAPRR